MQGEKNSASVRKMFNEIAGKYDFLNHFLSFGIDRRWRKRLVKILAKKSPEQILDVATGTGDLAIAISKLNPEKIIGIDIALNMLKIAEEKTSRLGLSGMISFVEGDSEHIPFPDGSFDAVTVAFGVRNYENLDRGLQEMRRVLVPGGSMLILEFSQPGSMLMRGLYRFYSKTFIPVAGRLISKHHRAYSYLPETVATFPSGDAFLAIMTRAGMRNTCRYPLTSGIATIYYGEK
jgi:demethylmenaquinone methyltransferase / 2-methoxy-6-polyprenyl-1,4-benzoquinol methylase